MTAARKPPSGRRIVVDGVEYRWKAGTGMIEIRRDGRVVLRRHTDHVRGYVGEALGLTPDQHARAVRKRTLNCAITPSMIADLIRGAACAAQPSADLLVVCETVAAVVPHLRIVTAESPIKLGGHHPAPKTLCGRDAGWDTQLPLTSARCTTCLSERAKLQAGVA